MNRVILLANYRPNHGGISSQIDILITKFTSVQYQIQLFNMNGNIRKRMILFINLFKIVKYYDVVHIHGCSYRGFLPIVVGLIVSKIQNRKSIATYHGGDLKSFIQRYPFIVRFTLHMADKVSVPSDYLRQIFNNYKIQSHVLNNLVQDDYLKFRKREEISPNLIVTRMLEEEYNVKLIIELFPQLKKIYPDATLKIIGDGSQKKQLQTYVQNMKMKDIIFYGRVDKKTLGKLLNSSDIFINPTNKDSFSISMFEAFACGLVVVSTNAGAIPEFLLDGQNGLMVDCEDSEELLRKISFAIDHSQESLGMIDNAYKSYLSCTWPNLQESYESLYE
jgi:L-malate glycosyltransferase